MQGDEARAKLCRASNSRFQPKDVIASPAKQSHHLIVCCIAMFSRSETREGLFDKFFSFLQYLHILCTACALLKFSAAAIVISTVEGSKIFGSGGLKTGLQLAGV
jgi:hypothetical protein